MAKTKKRATKKGPAKKKTGKTKRRLPEVVALIFCDAVAAGPGHLKPTLYGVFDRLNVRDTTKPVQPLTVYLKICGGEGEYDLGFEIASPDGTRLSSGGGKKITLESTTIATAISQIAKLRFPKSGVYRLFATADDKRFGTPCPLIVNLPKTEK